MFNSPLSSRLRPLSPESPTFGGGGGRRGSSFARTPSPASILRTPRSSLRAFPDDHFSSYRRRGRSRSYSRGRDIGRDIPIYDDISPRRFRSPPPRSAVRYLNNKPYWNRNRSGHRHRSHSRRTRSCSRHHDSDGFIKGALSASIGALAFSGGRSLVRNLSSRSRHRRSASRGISRRSSGRGRSRIRSRSRGDVRRRSSSADSCSMSGGLGR